MKLGQHLRLDRLHQIEIRVGDLDAALSFYCDTLELTLIARFDPLGIAFFELGGARLMLARASEDSKRGASTLYTRVLDIEQAFQALLDRGVVFEQGPQAIHHDTDGLFGPKGGSEWMAFFRDPSGNLLALAARR